MLRAQVEVAAGAAPHDPVAQIIERELLAGAIRDVAGVSALTAGSVERLRHEAHAQTQSCIKRPQRLSVPRDEIVVGRDHVDRDSGQRRGGGANRGGECLAFAGGHFREPVVEHDARSHELAVIGADAEGTRAQASLTSANALGHHRIDEAVAPEPRANQRQTLLQLCRSRRHERRVGLPHQREKASIAAAMKTAKGRERCLHALCCARERVIGAGATLRIGAEENAGSGKRVESHRISP